MGRSRTASRLETDVRGGRLGRGAGQGARRWRSGRRADARTVWPHRRLRGQPRHRILALAAVMMYDRWLHELWNGDLNKLETIARDVVSADFVGNWPGR